MIIKEYIEFIIMLLIENRILNDTDNEYYDYIERHYDLEAYNNRYMELLDKFFKTHYALNKTEKSENTILQLMK